jgi:hypothetical protein
MSSVRPATYDSVVNGSWNGSVWSYGPSQPPGRSGLAPRTWSYVSRWSKPLDSAVDTNASMVSRSVPTSGGNKVPMRILVPRTPPAKS